MNAFASCKQDHINDFDDRYERQLLVSEIGQSGQAILSRSKVLVVGAGGLGSPALSYLAAAGVGRISIVDHDVVALSNLNRQLLYQTDDIGRPKAEVAKERLVRLNPEIDIVTYPVELNERNIDQIISDNDIVIDAVDNMPTRELINRACFQKKKPVVEGTVSGFDGMLITILPDSSPCFHCLFGSQRMDASGDRTGVIGAMAGVIGALQAMEAIKYLLKAGDLLTDRLLLFDGLRMQFRQIGVARKADCPWCGGRSASDNRI